MRTKSQSSKKQLTQRPKDVETFSIKDRQEKLIELNQKKLIPENELANSLLNIKNSQKSVYSMSIASYLEECSKIVSDIKIKKKPTKWSTTIHLSYKKILININFCTSVSSTRFRLNLKFYSVLSLMGPQSLIDI